MSTDNESETETETKEASISNQVLQTIIYQAMQSDQNGCYLKWEDYDNEDKPTFDEKWFWKNFESCVDEVIMSYFDVLVEQYRDDFEYNILETLHEPDWVKGAE